MNILFSLTYYFPYTSGLSIIAKRLAEKVIKHKVSVICAQHDTKTSLNETIGNVEIFRTKPNLRVSKGFLSIEWIIKSWKHVKKNDILFVFLPQPEGIFPTIFALLLRKKIVSLYLAEVKLRGGVFSKIIELIVNILNQVILLLSNKVITYSKEYAEYVPELKLFLPKTECIYPPVPTMTINSKEIEKIKSFINNSNGITIGVQARMAEDKGFEYLFDALPIVESVLEKKVTLLIAGPTDPVGENRYKKRIMEKAENIKDSLIFLGNLDQSKMGSFYKSIDILVYPSILESFGLGQVEAMMLGVPVVASNLPGANVPILRTGLGELVPPQNPRLLAETIAKVINNKKDYIDPKRAILEFSLEKVVESYDSLLKKLS